MQQKEDGKSRRDGEKRQRLVREEQMWVEVDARHPKIKNEKSATGTQSGWGMYTTLFGAKTLSLCTGPSPLQRMNSMTSLFQLSDMLK